MRTDTDNAGRPQIAEAVVSRLSGFAVTRVAYLIPATMAGNTRPHASGFEIAESGVRLIDPAGRHRDIRWAQDGFDEGLWFGEQTGPDDERLWSPNVQLVDSNSWPHRGQSSVVERVTVIWQQIGPSRFSIWSVRLLLGGESIVVCLGERDYETGLPTYIPDCVMVLFDEQVAREYHPSASFDSAWGPAGGESGSE